jgi:hypothetical protein
LGELDASFEKLLGRQPTDRERQRLYRVRDALNLKPTDAVWQLLMALEHYETLYEKMPALIAEAARDAMKATRAAAEAESKAARDATKRALMDAVHQAAIVSAKRAAGAELWKWICTAVILVSVAFGVVTGGAYGRGVTAGLTRGMADARARYESAAAAASWANTPEGRLAYDMARIGSLHDLATCSGRGLVARDGWCIVQAERGKGYRWRLPSDR